MERELHESAKEQAEHLMLVDLGRNDVGRVCEIGSVEVSDYAAVRRYGHVMHLETSIQGRLRAGLTAVDALRACFPAGTVTGAPKVRAMEIIAELEPEVRGAYAGAVGYLDFRGSLDTAIALRTAVVRQGRLHLQAAAGIVADSDPAEEAREIDNKLRALAMAAESLRRGGAAAAAAGSGGPGAVSAPATSCAGQPRERGVQPSRPRPRRFGPGCRQLRLLHLQPGPAAGRAGGALRGGAQRHRHGGGDRGAPAGGGGDLAGAEDPRRRRDLGGADPRARRAHPHPRGVPGAPGHRGGLRWPGGAGAVADARQAEPGPPRRRRALRRGARPLHGHPVPLAGGGARRPCPRPWRSPPAPTTG